MSAAKGKSGGAVNLVASVDWHTISPHQTQKGMTVLDTEASARLDRNPETKARLLAAESDIHNAVLVDLDENGNVIG